MIEYISILFILITMGIIFRKNNAFLLCTCLFLRFAVLFPLQCVSGVCGFLKNVSQCIGEIIVNSTKIVYSIFAGFSWICGQLEGCSRFGVFICTKIENKLVQTIQKDDQIIPLGFFDQPLLKHSC